MRAAMLLGVACLVLPACAGTSILDVERARRLFEQKPKLPAPPEVEESPTVELPSPEGLRAVSGQLRSVPLRWEPLLVGDVAGYAVERGFAREGPYQRIATVTGRLSANYLDERAYAATAKDDATRDGVTLFYRVRAYSPSGQLAIGTSEVATASTAKPPNPPENLLAYSHQPRQVPLSWTAAEDPNVAGYVLERSPSATGPFARLAEISGRYETSHTDRGLGDLRVFYYRVASRNSAGGVGSPSPTVRAFTKPEPLPPIGLRVHAQALGVNELRWEPNVEKDVTQYRLLRTREGADGPEVVTTVARDQTMARDGGVGAGEVLSYTLVAFDRDDLESVPSEKLEVKGQPYGLTATLKPDGVHLTWRDRSNEGFRGARVFRASGFGQRELSVATGSSIVDPDVTPGRRYRYTVILERPGGVPAPRSAPVEIQVPKR